MMLVFIVAVVAGLVGLAGHAHAQELDPIRNMCNRFDHQCTIHFLKGKMLLRTVANV